MPYIAEALRDYYEPHCPPAEVPGQLNFQITCLIKQYMSNRPLDYQTINDVLGAIEGVKLEFYRRIAAPYEFQKIEENGDVY